MTLTFRDNNVVIEACPVSGTFVNGKEVYGQVWGNVDYPTIIQFLGRQLPHQVEKAYPGLFAWWDGDGRCLATTRRLSHTEYIDLLLNQVGNSYGAAYEHLLSFHSQLHPLVEEYPNPPRQKFVLGVSTTGYSVFGDNPSPYGKSKPGGTLLLVALYPGGESKVFNVSEVDFTIRPPDRVLEGYGDSSAHGTNGSSWGTEFSVWKDPDPANGSGIYTGRTSFFIKKVFAQQQ